MYENVVFFLNRKVCSLAKLKMVINWKKQKLTTKKKIKILCNFVLT